MCLLDTDLGMWRGCHKRAKVMEQEQVIVWSSHVRSRLDRLKSDSELTPNVKRALVGEEALGAVGHAGRAQVLRRAVCHAVLFEH